MQKVYSLLQFLTLFFFIGSFSQNNSELNKTKINNALENYYKLDRENIHLHLNKSQFITTDKIWLKGYITEKKTGLPYEKTTNVYVTLFDEKGTKIKTSLFYAENSTFEGALSLDPNTKTGVYYIHVFTNYMNNFLEDESSSFKIYIINAGEKKALSKKKTTLNNASISLYPEGGLFLEGVVNTVAVTIKDCYNQGISVKDAIVTDSKGQALTTFSTNQFGYGKFDILTLQNETYKIKASTGDLLVEKQLPNPALTGITITANNYTFPDKTILKLKTNERTLKSNPKESYSIVIQKNNSASHLEFSFDGQTDKTISIASSNLPEGVNCIRVLDKNLTQIAERNIFKPLFFKNNLEMAVAKKSNDSIQIRGNSNMKFAEMSISILPDGALFDNSEQTILGKTFNDINPTIPNPSYFNDNFSKKKHYELDNILITTQSKYNWNAILTTSPTEKYEFDSGLTIKGTVNSEIKEKKDYSVNLNSALLGINEFSPLNEKSEFYFKNIYATDSTKVHFSLINKKAKLTELKMYSTITNNKQKFTKPLKPNQNTCQELFESADANDFFPISNNAIMLEDIKLNTQKKKPELENVLKFNNNMSKGYKISDKDQTSFRDVLQFIASHGYDVRYEAGTVIIIGRASTSFLGTKSPLVFMDDVPVTDFNLLLNYSLIYIDEIYINKRGFGGGIGASNGIIRIYTKKGFGAEKSSIRIKSGSLLIEDGFQPITAYKTPNYTNFSNEGFLNYGTINWIPRVQTDENGNFKFAFPNLYQSSVKIIIEGISSDGQVISEVKTIAIP